MSYTPLGELKTQTVSLTPEEIERLKEDPTNEVYEFEDKHLEPWQKMDARDAESMAQDIRARYLALRREDPDRSDDDIRSAIRAEKTAWESFAGASHSTIFQACTDRTTDDKKEEIMRYLCRVRDRVDQGLLGEAEGEAHIQEYLFKKCTRNT